MDISKQSQKAGDNSVNLQAENISVHTGLSISHVKEIALDVFKDNFLSLSGAAMETATQRVNVFTDQFIEELAEKNPEGLSESEDPDFQYSLFEAQKEYARSGEKELGDMLVGLLVDRTKEKDRSLLRIVLTESLSIAPKLSGSQLDILACLFHIALTQNHKIDSIDSLKCYIDDTLLEFGRRIRDVHSDCRHIEYTGCAAKRAGTRNFIGTIKSRYQGLFCKGYSIESIKELSDANPRVQEVHIQCLHDSKLIQARGITDAVTRSECESLGIPEEDTEAIIQINQQHLMAEHEAQTFLIGICPEFGKFLETIGNTSFNNMELTSVGIAIAHAHSRRKIDYEPGLANWI